MAEVSVAGERRDREASCVRCGDRGWVPYQQETLDGETEEAWEICECLRSIVLEEIAAEERKVLKAYRVFTAHADEIIASYRKGVYWIPSASRRGLKHGVRFTRRMKACSCEDKQINRVEECWHIHCARFAASESACCDGCSKRFHGSKLKQVQNEDAFAFFPGDWVCPSCLKGSDAEAC